MRKSPLISDYELLRPIGRGAYGEVWLARGVTGLLRAVKIVRRDTFGTAEPFEREFRGLTEFAAISLVASNQLALLHVGRDREGGFFYYVMELADDVESGRDIDIERYTPCTLKALQQKKGRLSTDEAITIGVGLARGLASLHSHGLVHRDIKPANIIFVGGIPKLADIGLVADAELGQSIVGTDGFIPPEGPGKPPADVYSAGKVLYELNTGLDRKSFPTLPYEPDPASDHRRFLGLNEVVLRACAPDAARRYPTAEALLEDLVALQTGRGMLGKRVVRWMSPTLFRLAVGVGVIGVAAAGAWLWPKISTSTSSSPASTPISARSIAVLPFKYVATFSDAPQPDASLFAQGVHEDVILRLAKIQDLKVISHAAVSGYQEGSKSPKAIAAELGVGLILKGTVKREKDGINVNVELVDSSGFVRWAAKYKDTRLTEAFAIRSAQQIAGTLHAKMTENERRPVEHHPTANKAAYDLFVQAREQFRRLGSYADRDAYEKVVRLCEQAIALDGTFAEPHAQASLVHSFLYRFAHLDPTKERLDKATEAANNAERFGANLPEAKLARGVVAYLKRQWESALLEFRAAEVQLPNDEQLLWWKGNALRRSNLWSEAIDSLLSSSQVGPRVPLGSVTAIQTMRYLRRFTEARDLAQVERQRFPDDRPLQAEYGRCQFEVSGDRAAFFNWMDNMPEGEIRGESTLLQRKYESAYRRGDWKTADRLLADPKLTGIGENPSYINTPVALHRALVAWLTDPQNRRDEIRGHAVQALRAYGREDWNPGEEWTPRASWTPRQVPWVMIGAARAFALMGRAEQALSMADVGWKAVAVDNIDAADAAIMRTKVAEVHIILGQTEEALRVLAEMMRRPADAGPNALRADPVWKKLANDPRFEAILRSATAL